MSNQGNQGNRDREGNLGQPGSGKENPAGTSGRQPAADRSRRRRGAPIAMKTTIPAGSATARPSASYS